MVASEVAVLEVVLTGDRRAQYRARDPVRAHGRGAFCAV